MSYCDKFIGKMRQSWNDNQMFFVIDNQTVVKAAVDVANVIGCGVGYPAIVIVMTTSRAYFFPIQPLVVRCDYSRPHFIYLKGKHSNSLDQLILKTSQG